jgi:CRISPR-associated protein Csx3
MKIVLCGPPQSGKSCLREGLKQAIRRLDGAPYPYVITACPDGEGAWFSETAGRNPDEARQLKTAYKTQFTDEFAVVRAKWVKDCQESLTLIDVGGRIDGKNRIIMQHATHAVILAGEMAKVAEWEAFCTELNLQILAIIYSDYQGMCDRIDSETPILRGSVHHLERGEDISTRPIVQALARVLVSMCGK